MKIFQIIGSLACLSPIVATIGLTSCSAAYQYIDIVSLNDFHGYIDSPTAVHSPESPAPIIDYLASLYTQIRQEDKVANNTEGYESTYFILNGDNSQGTALSNLSNPSGKNTYEMLKNFGPQYSSIGNHEFDWGQQFLDPTLAKEESTETFKDMGGLEAMLACNIYHYDDQAHYTQVDWAQPYAVANINGLKVGFVGYTTAETMTTTSKTNLEDIAFADAADPETTVGDTGKTGPQILQETIDKCRDQENPDVLILLAHEGATYETGTKTLDPESAIFNVIGNITGIDACISGHTHLAYTTEANEKDGTKVPVGQAGKYGDSLLQTIISYDPKDHSSFEISMKVRDTESKSNKTASELIEQDPTGFVKQVDTQFEQIYAEMQPTLEKPKFNVTAVDATSSVYYDQAADAYNIPKNIPSSGDLSNALMAPAGAFLNDALGTILSSEVLNDTSTFPEFADIKKQVEDPNFNGVDIAITNAGGIRNDLIAHKNTESNQYEVTTKSLYDLSSFDNTTVIIKITVQDLLDYLNIYRKTNTADPFYSDKYLLQYTGNSYLGNLGGISLVDKETKTEVPSNTEIFVAMNEFFYLDGDGSKWTEAAGDNAWRVSAEGGKNNKFQIFTDARGTIIEYIYVLNKISSTKLDSLPTLTLGDQWDYNNDNYFYHKI